MVGLEISKSMEHFYQNLHGWFNYQDLYKKQVERITEPAHFVEVGCWKGMSAAFMAVEIINSGKNIKFDCVDIWTGAGKVGEYDHHDSVQNQTLYEEFIENMKPVEGYYTPIREWSSNAAKLYEDNSLDFVFIDAGHEYEFVHADILAWMPKIKSGGWIAGHDYPRAPGVKQAVDELIKEFNTSNACWIKGPLK